MGVARRRSRRAARLALCASLFAASAAHAGNHRFEPTDLEIEKPGTLEMNVQIGMSHGDGARGRRLYVPDYEMDVGLLPNAELDLDGAISLDRFDERRELASEPLWLAMKLGLFDDRKSAHESSWAVGVQLGPRIPVLTDRGMGYEALALLGYAHEHVHLVFSAGGIVDPGDGPRSGRPASVNFGVDVDLDLDDRGSVSLLGELGGALYLSQDPHELTLTLGPSWAIARDFEVSAILLAGALERTDRLGILLGFSHKFRL